MSDPTYNKSTKMWQWRCPEEGCRFAAYGPFKAETTVRQNAAIHQSKHKKK